MRPTPSPDDTHASNPGTLGRVAVVLPTWLGDAVMATPALRVLAQAAAGRMTLVGSPPVLSVLSPWPESEGAIPITRRILADARRLRAGRFDSAVLLPNSFRWALVARMARIPRRIGYARDARGWLLTDRIAAPRDRGRWAMTPAVDYYQSLAHAVAGRWASPSSTAARLWLPEPPEQRQRVRQQLIDAGWNPARPLVLLSPGASRISKRWSPTRFAALADACTTRWNAQPAVTVGPAEHAIGQTVIHDAEWPVLDLQAAGIDLAGLRSVFALAKILVTNDSGPRHLAAAMGCPVVAIFGPTEPGWTSIPFEHDHHVQASPRCDACRNKRRAIAPGCTCMTRIEVEHVVRRLSPILDDPQMQTAVRHQGAVG